MKQWIIFLIVPIISYMIIDPLTSFVLFGFFDMTWDDGWFRFWHFISYTIIGGIFFACSPNKNKALAITFAVCLCIYDIYLGITTDGQMVNLFGIDIPLEYHMLTALIGYAGIIFGIVSAAEAEKDEAQKNAAA